MLAHASSSLSIFVASTNTLVTFPELSTLIQSKWGTHPQSWQCIPKCPKVAEFIIVLANLSFMHLPVPIKH